MVKDSRSIVHVGESEVVRCVQGFMRGRLVADVCVLSSIQIKGCLFLTDKVNKYKMLILVIAGYLLNDQWC